MSSKCGLCSSTCKKTDAIICALCNSSQHYNCIIEQTPTMAQSMIDNITKAKTGFSFGCKKCVENSIMNPFTNKFDALEKQLQDLANFIKESITSQLSEIKIDLAKSLSHSKNFEEETVSKITMLERENNNIRKQMNRPDIIVTGLKKNLETEKLYELPISIAKACGVVLSESDVNFCTYIKKKSAVLIKLNSVLKRDAIMMSYRENYDLTLDQVTDTDVGSRVFLNDHYIPLVAKLRYICRKKKQANEIESYKVRNSEPYMVKLVYKNKKEVEINGLDLINGIPNQQIAVSNNAIQESGNPTQIQLNGEANVAIQGANSVLIQQNAESNAGNEEDDS